MQLYFLHISDIHCGYDNYAVSNMRESLPKAIRDFTKSKGQKIECIFITGDLKYGKANPVEYPPETLEFIKDLQEILSIPPDKTFIVPGNHDVTRGLARASAINEVKKSYSSLQGEISSECMNVLAQTRNEFKKIYRKICGRTYNKDHYYIDLGPINIIHLNTALICGQDNEDGSLIIGMSLLKKALKAMDTSKPAIVLGHHSFDCFTTTEQSELERFLKSKNALLYLCGHKHITRFTEISTVEKSKPLWEFLCGTNMDKDPNLPSTDMDVFVGTINTERNCGYFDAYKWSHKSGKWMPDSDFSFSESESTDGRIYYPAKSAYLSSEALDQYIQYLRISCSDIRLDGLPVDGYIGSRRFPLDLLYVPIRFKKRFLSLQEELEAKFDELFGPIDDDKQKGKRRISRYPSPIHEDVFNSIILAGPGHGKTTYLKKVINYYSSAVLTDSADDFPKIPLYPIWIKCRSLNSRKDFSIMSILKDLPTFAEFPPDPELEKSFSDAIFTKIKRGEAIILIDGLDEISDAAKRSLFIEQIDVFSKQYERTRILITSRIAGYEDYNKSGLMGFETFEIQPFDDEDIRALCIKWHSAVVNSLNETTSYANELADTIISNDRIKTLAVNPLLLTTLLLVQRRIGRLPTKRVALYEESIKVLLETWNQEGHAPMDIAIALCKLAYIAFYMTSKGIQQIRKNDLISLLYSAQDDLKRKLSFDSETPEQFIKKTEQRSSLIAKTGYSEDKNGTLHEIYEFQHLTFQEYLTALAIVDKYYPKAKRTDNVADVLSDPNGIDAFRLASKNEEIILLTAALSGWNAEDIALALLDRITKSQDLPSEYGGLCRLAIMLILDEAELEEDTIHELLRAALVKPTKYLVNNIQQLLSTKYLDIVQKIVSERAEEWLEDSVSNFVLLLPYINIDIDLGETIADKLSALYYKDLEEYCRVSTSILIHILERKPTENTSITKIIAASLLVIDEEKAEIIDRLIESQYAQIIIESLKKCTIWEFDRFSEGMLNLIRKDPYFTKKMKTQLQKAYDTNRKEYNKLSKKILLLLNELELTDTELEDLFTLCCKSVTPEKGKVILKLLDGKFSSKIENLADEEHTKWIDGTNCMSYVVHILVLIKYAVSLHFQTGLKHILAFFEDNKNGEVKSVVEAIQVVDVYCWLNDSKRITQLNCSYRSFLWSCIDDPRPAVATAALEALYFIPEELSSVELSQRIINVHQKLIMGGRNMRRVFGLYPHMPTSIKLHNLACNCELYKHSVMDTLHGDYPMRQRAGALIAAILNGLVDASESKRTVATLHLEEELLEKIKGFIEVCYSSTNNSTINSLQESEVCLSIGD